MVSLAYLVDIFSRLNEVNLSLQGKDKTVIKFIDILSAFQAKLELWERKMAMDKTGMFPVLNALLEDNANYIDNLQSLHSEFAKYIPDVRDDLSFVRNLYLITDKENQR